MRCDRLDFVVLACSGKKSSTVQQRVIDEGRVVLDVVEQDESAAVSRWWS